MICLNKADEASLRHLAWNQSPPALAPGSTTRQDLNGIANLRQFVAAAQDAAAAAGAAAGASAAELGATRCDVHRPWPVAAAPDAGRQSALHGLSSRLSRAAGGHGRARRPGGPSARGWASARSWAAWALSVLVAAYLLASLTSLARWDRRRPGPARRRLSARSACKSGGVDAADYDTPLHVVALLIIWLVSTLGCAFPIVAARLPGLRIPRRFFFAVRHFGTGVLLATAFVHLLPTAFVSLGNPCLGDFWTKDYEAMPGAIALAAIFLVAVVEMALHPSRRVPPPPAAPAAAPAHLCSATAMLPFRDGPLHGRASSVGQGLAQLSGDGASGNDSDNNDSNNDTNNNNNNSSSNNGSNASKPDLPQLSAELRRRKERLQCVLLEMGILFHSVFIGMALSVSIGTDFVVLLVAIVFHQTFEGLALGARIAAIEWGARRAWQPWAMAAAYGCTTPLGQAIGLATHTLYSPDSSVGLVVVGVMNAISAGLLTFASLVELLSEDFLSDESWRHLRGGGRVVACLLVFFGAFFMSLVGAWA